MEPQHEFHEVLVEPDYGQFYLRRAGQVVWQSADVPSDGYERLLWSSGSFVMVGTVRKYGATRLRVQVVEAAPIVPPAEEAQHVVEDSLAPGGDLEIFSWDGGTPVATVAVPHSSVRLRVLWSGLREENRFEGMDEEGNSDENLLILVWPQAIAGPEVLRCWPPVDLPPPSERSRDGRRQIEGLEAVIDQWDHLELVHQFSHPHPSLPGSLEDHSSAHGIYRDQRDGTLWADGSDVRRVLRELTQAEADEMEREAGGPR